MTPKPPSRVFEVRVATRHHGSRTLHRYAPSEAAACTAARLLPSAIRVLSCIPLTSKETRAVLGLTKGGRR